MKFRKLTTNNQQTQFNNSIKKPKLKQKKKAIKYQIIK